MGDLEFCENESGEVDKTFSTLLVTCFLTTKKFFETIQFFWWRPGFFEKGLHFCSFRHLSGAVVAMNFCGKKNPNSFYECQFHVYK